MTDEEAQARSRAAHPSRDWSGHLSVVESPDVVPGISPGLRRWVIGALVLITGLTLYVVLKRSGLFQ